MSKAKILVIEDEKDVQELMLLHLRRDGHEPTGVENGEQGLQLFKSGSFDLVVLDWMLPGLSGLEICKQLKDQVPILMVTARSDTSDIVLGLEMGADDYITKPFDLAVFRARVRALLRRRGIVAAADRTKLQTGKLVLDLDAHEVSCDSKPVPLTKSEFRLLSALLKHRGKVLSREKLIEFVQGEDVTVTDRTVDTHVFGLRKKLGDCGDFIETIRGVGYRVRIE